MLAGPRFRSRSWFALAFVATGLVAACSFGVDLDNLVGGEDASDGGLSDSNAPDTGAPSDAGADVIPVASVDLEQIASGSNFTCVRKSTGVVACWGRGTEGRLGDGTGTSSSSPVEVRDLRDAIDLAVGSNHVCAIRQGGDVYCWGYNEGKQLGTTTTAEGRIPQPTLNMPGKAVQLAAGLSFTCALLEDKTVACWGDNSQSQLGVGDALSRPGPVVVEGLTDVTQIATTVTAACALTGAGEVYCWGDNEDGQSGSGDAGLDLGSPRKVETIANVRSLSVGATADHFCAVVGEGEVKCWGFNDNGNLGNGTVGDSALPVSALTLTDITKVATGAGYSCGVHEDGRVSCWGNNAHRTLAIGEAAVPSSSNTALVAQGLDGITQVATGGSHACALRGKREVYCWGSDVYGALGRERPLVSNVPVKVAGPTSFRTLANGRNHACGLDIDGGVSCWGDNVYRQLGRADVTSSGEATPVAGLVAISRIATGDNHSCVVIADGGVRCWGAGESGTLGTGGSSVFGQTTPVAFVAPRAIDVAGGTNLTCALLHGGNVSCAGSSGDGKLGSAGSSTSTPRLVIAQGDGGATPGPFEEALSLSVGRYHACVVWGSSRNVACWGNNESSQLGRTGGGTSPTPANVPLTKPAAQVACGFRHTCARISGNETMCWGRNVSGQITGTAGTSPTPRTVTYPDGHYAIDLALGDDHSCAILDDRTVACWGANAFGQLGTGSFTDANQPTLVTGITGATAITADESHTCAVTETGTFCWGTDFSGQLGVANVMLTGVPVAIGGL